MSELYKRQLNYMFLLFVKEIKINTYILISLYTTYDVIINKCLESFAERDIL